VFDIKYLEELKKRNKMIFPVHLVPEKEHLEIYRKYGFTFGPFKL